MIHLKLFFYLSVAALLLGSTPATRAALPASLILTVNRTDDGSDRNPGDGICDASVNAGEQCSLRAAIQELNAQGAGATPHRIEFNIPGTGPFTIQPVSQLPSILVPVEIDGTTQPGAACPTDSAPANLMIVLYGSGAGGPDDGLELFFSSDGSMIRGMVIGNFFRSGIWVWSDSNQFSCNHLGISADGVTEIGNEVWGLFVVGFNNTIGGQSSPSQRNVISGNMINLDVVGDNNIIRNNFIGTTASGDQSVDTAITDTGINVWGNNNTIGGIGPVARNVISGNAGDGMQVQGDNNIIFGNGIGTAADGVTPLGNLENGILFELGASGNVVGGSASSEANRIAYNGISGIGSDDPSVPTARNVIRGNSIYANGELGIDLAPDGVTGNDSGDADGGENELQNYPVLAFNPGSEILSGALNSQPNTNYIVDLYLNESCDPSGHGEGEQYLDTLLVTSDGSGQASFQVNLAGRVSPGSGVAATATDPNGNTSEFSNCATQVFTENELAVFLPLVTR